MIQLQFNRQAGTWAVTRDGATVAAGLTMLEANRLYAALIGQTLIGKTTKRKVFR